MADIWIDVDTALTELPVNKVPLVASSDGFTTDETIAYNEAGMDLNWNFITSAGSFTQTNVVPTTAGTHDWTHQGNAMYTIEVPASAGTINNDTEGYGWFSGVATGVVPFTSPIYGFRAAALNDALCDGGDSLDVNLAAGAITDASLAGNMEIVFETDFATNYNVTRNAWATNRQDFVGTTSTDPFAGTVVAASVTGAVGSVAGNVDGNVTGSVGSNLELGPAEVNTEVDNALNVTTYTEPGQGAPGVNVSLVDKIGYLYKAWRNRSNETATTYQLYADDTTTVDQKVTVSDDATTFEKSEVGTGP